MSARETTKPDSSTMVLVGTGHVLEKSVREVEAVIDRERPDIVAVELDEARYRALKGEMKEVSPKEMLSAGNPFLIPSCFPYHQQIEMPATKLKTQINAAAHSAVAEKIGLFCRFVCNTNASQATANVPNVLARRGRRSRAAMSYCTRTTVFVSLCRMAG